MISFGRLKAKFYGDWRLEATLQKYYVCTAFHEESKLFETNTYSTDDEWGIWYQHMHRYISLDKDNAIRWHYKAIDLITKREREKEGSS